LRHRGRHKRVAPVRTVETEITEIGAKGDGVAMVDGEMVFVPNTTPGDFVQIEEQGGKGRVLELLRLGPDRIEPPCPLYGKCGGCALQHVTSNFYRSWKRDQVIAALAAVHIDTPVDVLVVLPAASRRRAQFYVQRSGAVAAIGFHKRRSRDLVPLNACLVLHPDLEKRLDALRDLASAAPHNWAAFAMSVTLCDNGLDINFTSSKELEEPHPKDLQKLTAAMTKAGVVRLSSNQEILVTLSAPSIRMGRTLISPPPGGFLQVSTEGQSTLTDLVCDAVRGAKKTADLFSGCGTFSLPLAEFTSVSAYDSDALAIDALRDAAGLAQAHGLTPVKAEVRNLFERPLSADELKDFNTVVVDPPRAGAIHQMRELAQSKVACVVSVSCNPKTFSRDARILMDGGFSLKKVTPVDQFVFSSHVELVGVFRKQK